MYTLEEARRRLGSITTAEELRELIANLDVTTSTGVTVLYSGSSGVIPGDIPETILTPADSWTFGPNPA
jgi:hypothetical protein